MNKKHNEWAETLEEFMKGERPRHEGSTTVLYLDELDRMSDAEMAVFKEHARAISKRNKANKRLKRVRKALEFVQMTRRPKHTSIEVTAEEREAFAAMKDKTAEEIDASLRWNEACNRIIRDAQTTAPTIRRIDKEVLLNKLNYTLECRAVAKQRATTVDDKTLINQSIWPIIDIIAYVKSMPEV